MKVWLGWCILCRRRVSTNKPVPMGLIKNAVVSLAFVWTIITITFSVYLVLNNYATVREDERIPESNTPPEQRMQLYHRDAVPLLEDAELKDFLKKMRSPEFQESMNEFEQVVAVSSLLPPIVNISRIPTPSSDVFLQYIAPVGLPVVFTDMLEGTSLSGWTWDMVQQRWGNHIYSNTRQGNYSPKVNRFGKHFIHRVTVKLKDFIDVVTGKREPTEKEKGLYITKQRVLPPDQLEKMFYYPPFYPGDKKKCFLEPTGWIGAPGTFTQGHIDSKDNFVYQLIGQKRWTIFPPRDYKHLYYHKEKGSLEWSAVLAQIGQPDLEKYPMFRETHPISFVMNPGEVLYLPRGWTHFVENVTPSLMLNTWRRGPAGILELWFPKSKTAIRNKCFE